MIYKYLFIDIETSGVNFKIDRIIEIGAIIAQIKFDSNNLTYFEVIDKFESLINPKIIIDQKIERLTGISKTDLANAPSASVVQDNWFDWIQKNIGEDENCLIVGHSIQDFDLNFLNYYKWYLPESYKIIDTLYLSKILLPNLPAINQEYLFNFFNFNINHQKYNHNNAEKYLTTDKHHRAFFDVLTNKFLLEKLLEYIKNYRFPQEFINILQKQFLPISELSLIALNNTKQITSNIVYTKHSKLLVDWKTNMSFSEIDFLLENYASFESELVYECINYYMDDLDLMDRDYNLIWLQICSIIYLKSINKYNQYFLHGKPHTQFISLLILRNLPFFQLKFKKYLEIIGNTKDVEYLTKPLECLIWQAGHIVNYKWRVSTLSYLLSIFGKLSYDLSNIILYNSVQRLLAQIDFLSISLLPLWNYNKFELNLNRQATMQVEQAIKKFLSFTNEISELLNILKTTGIPVRNGKYFSVFYLALLNTLSEFELLKNHQLFILSYLHQEIEFEALNKESTLEVFFESLFTKYPNIKLVTYLDVETMSELLDFLNIRSILSKREICKINTSSQNNTDSFLIDKVSMMADSDFLNYMQNILTDLDDKLCFILSGNNKANKQIELLIPNKLNKEKYLLIGESGSITKIFSKIKSGFRGIVFLRQKDLGYIINKKLDQKIYFIFYGEPHVYLSEIFVKNSQNQKKANRFYLDSLIGQATHFLVDRPKK
jgi:DNA polymerase III epsilon subunit-like protein